MVYKNTKTPFSWDKVRQNNLETKLRRAKIQATIAHPDFKKAHLDEVREAQTGKFTTLQIRVKKEVEEHQNLAIQRRLKRIGKTE